MSDSLLVRNPRGWGDQVMPFVMSWFPLGMLAWILEKTITGFQYTRKTPLRDWFIGMSVFAGFIAVTGFMAMLMLSAAMDYEEYLFTGDGVTISKYRLWWRRNSQFVPWSEVESIKQGLTGGTLTQGWALYLRTKAGKRHEVTRLGTKRAQGGTASWHSGMKRPAARTADERGLNCGGILYILASHCG